MILELIIKSKNVYKSWLESKFFREISPRSSVEIPKTLEMLLKCAAGEFFLKFAMKKLKNFRILKKLRKKRLENFPQYSTP